MPQRAMPTNLSPLTWGRLPEQQHQQHQQHQQEQQEQQTSPGENPAQGSAEKPQRDQGKPDQKQAGNDEGDKGFPANTPTSEMTVEQQAAYWKYQARKHEGRAKSSVSREDYDQVKSQLDEARRKSLTEDERAVEDRISTAVEQAEGRVRAEYTPRLVEASIRARIGEALTDDQISDQLAFVDLHKFLTDSGEVDTDKVNSYVQGIRPAGVNGWTFTPSGQERRAPHNTGKHTVASAKEDRLRKLRGE